MCSKHVVYYKTRICAVSWSITKIILSVRLQCQTLFLICQIHKVIGLNTFTSHNIQSLIFAVNLDYWTQEFTDLICVMYPCADCLDEKQTTR